MIKKKKTYKELEDEVNELRKRNEDLLKSSNYNYKKLNELFRFAEQFV